MLVKVQERRGRRLGLREPPVSCRWALGEGRVMNGGAGARAAVELAARVRGVLGKTSPALDACWFPFFAGSGLDEPSQGAGIAVDFGGVRQLGLSVIHVPLSTFSLTGKPSVLWHSQGGQNSNTWSCISGQTFV